MAIGRYSYIVTGTGANNRPWETAGVVACEWHEVLDRALEQSAR
ncbi:MAG TPA: hypothetical protein VGJ20_31425 [Xanthobacteraceae bacterium]